MSKRILSDSDLEWYAVRDLYPCESEMLVSVIRENRAAIHEAVKRLDGLREETDLASAYEVAKSIRDLLSAALQETGSLPAPPSAKEAR